eukprot:NODE_50_length_31184_cov_0.705099.p29 type:complete len:122 gc:universal NODE_50_length_31184_cov_0.705099:4036-3671(-)
MRHKTPCLSFALTVPTTRFLYPKSKSWRPSVAKSFSKTLRQNSESESSECSLINSKSSISLVARIAIDCSVALDCTISFRHSFPTFVSNLKGILSKTGMNADSHPKVCDFEFSVLILCQAA